MDALADVAAKQTDSSEPAALKPAPAVRPSTRGPRNGAWWTSASRILAGMSAPVVPDLVEFSKHQAVVQHRADFHRAWLKFAAERLKPVTTFAGRELSGPESAGPLYYPFSGPDILYGLALFPNAAEIALTGLEPVGDVPDLTNLDDEQIAGSLAQLRRSLNAILAFSFFRTNDMRDEFANNRLSGVTPIMLIFLARHQAVITGVQPFILEKDSNLRNVPPWFLYNLVVERIPGVRISFTLPNDARERKLYYFSADLSDAGLAKTPQYLAWMNAFEPRVSLVKSASYLMHKNYFSDVRSFILERSNLVVQDDSGVPMRLFAEQIWDRKMFGSYAGPIPLFANWYQKDMKSAYDKAALSIEFGIGYQHVSKKSNLQIFQRRVHRASS
ncbi:MAG: hypothetical protein EXR39_07035 [Betaproteobacteria bacterium]|nr:hypothetical protein [Betaproteobacteria bacterium]